MLDAAHASGLEIVEARLSPDELMQADEAFLTNSVIGVVPIVDLCGRVLTVGAMTRRVQHVVAETVAASPRGWPSL